MTKQTWRADNPSSSKRDFCCSKSAVQGSNDDDNLFQAEDEMESFNDVEDVIIEDYITLDYESSNETGSGLLMFA